MKKTNWSSSWKASKQPRKQRLYRFNAPLHVSTKLDGSHLSKELQKKYNTRSIVPRKGDKVKILRGNFKGKIAKISRIDKKKSKLYIEGIERPKKDGSKSQVPIHMTNVIVTDINLDDKKRQEKLSKNGKKTP